MVFKVHKTSLTGTLNNPLVGKTKIKDGKIDGDNISFYIVRVLNGYEVRVLWKGKVEGDVIKFTSVSTIMGTKHAIALRPKAVEPAQTTK
jgi:hypothetical protein